VSCYAIFGNLVVSYHAMFSNLVIEVNRDV